MLKYMIRFRVEPRTKLSTFPIDMLRYDVCRPATEEDSARILRSMSAYGKEAEPVWLIHYSDRKEGRLTDARWRSFGWRIAEVQPADRMD